MLFVLFHLGKERYALKFRYALGLQQTPEQLPPRGSRMHRCHRALDCMMATRPG